MATKTTDLVLEGVGSAYMIGTDGSISPLGKLEDMQISISTTTEKVYGGDSIFNFYEFIKEKTCGFTFTNATFNLNMIQLSQGSSDAVGECYGSDIVTSATHTAQLTVTSGISTKAGDTSIIDNTTGLPLTVVTGAPTKATEVQISASGVVTFYTSVADGGSYTISYVYTKSGTVGTDILTTSVPGFVELRHISKTITMPSGVKYRVHTRIYKARCDGKLDIDFKRSAASAPKLTFTSLDPQRADKKFCSFTIEEVA